MQMITGGTVTFMRRVKTGDYEHAEAKAELSFSVAPDGDVEGEALMKMAGMLAHRQVFELLGLKVNVPPAITQTVTVPAATTASAPAGDPPPEKKKPGRPPGTSNKVKLEPKNAPAPALPPVDALANVDDDIMREEIEDDIDSAAEPEITDAQMQKAIADQQEKVRNAPAIRKLIGKFVAAPGRSTDIPQEMRKQFLAELKDVKPLA